MYFFILSEAALYTISDGHKKTRGEKNNDIRLRRSRLIGEIEDRFEDEIKREDSRCRLIQSMNEGHNEMRHEYYLGTAGLHIQSVQIVLFNKYLSERASERVSE